MEEEWKSGKSLKPQIAYQGAHERSPPQRDGEEPPNATKADDESCGSRHQSEIAPLYSFRPALGIRQGTMHRRGVLALGEHHRYAQHSFAGDFQSVLTSRYQHFQKTVDRFTFLCHTAKFFSTSLEYIVRPVSRALSSVYILPSLTYREDHA